MKKRKCRHLKLRLTLFLNQYNFHKMFQKIMKVQCATHCLASGGGLVCTLESLPTPPLPQGEERVGHAAGVSNASTAEETEGEEELGAVAPQSEPEQENENQASGDEAHGSIETSVIEIPSLSLTLPPCAPSRQCLTSRPSPPLPTMIQLPGLMSLLYSFHRLQ
jgi:hypothetical protein